MRPLPQYGAPPEPALPSLPLAYFAAALMWLAGGGVGLILVAPDLAHGLVTLPRVIAVTHSLTLGVLASSIFGALHQFVPAVLGVDSRHPRAAVAGFWLFEAGVATLVVAFWRWSFLGQAGGWALIVLGVGGASWNILPARRRATRNPYIGTYISLGHSALGFALILAALRIGEGFGWWHASRGGVLAAHLHLGAAGFGTLTAVGFGSKMLPAFLGAHDVRTGPLVWIGWVAAGGLVLFTVGAVWRLEPALLAGALLLMLAAAGHLVLLGDYFIRRTRPIDPGLGFVLAATVCYTLAVVAGARLLRSRPLPGADWAAYAILLVLGWLGLLIVGVMHRVAPRMLALHRAGRGRRPMPIHQRVELISSPLAWAALVLLVTGTGGLVVAVTDGLVALATAAGFAVAGGAVLLLVQAVRLLRLTVQ